MKIIKRIIYSILLLLIVIFIWHQISNLLTKRSVEIPGDRIKIYDNEYIHAVKMGTGDYTIVFLPGMGTASPYYDYYILANEISKNNQVIIIEPLGYGFSDNTDNKRSLDNYEYELSTVLKYYNIEDNIILLGHSYSGISNLNYANKHNEVKGLVCLDCTTAYQVEPHVKDGKFTESVPKTTKLYTLVSPLGITRFAYSTFLRSTINNELLEDVPKEYQKTYKYLLYTKTMNKTIVNEINNIYYNQLEILYDKYNSNLHVLTILSDETVKEMQEYKKDGDFNQDWEEMHQLLLSNEKIQNIYILNGSHYIHHGNVDEISEKINNMINDIKQY